MEYMMVVFLVWALMAMQMPMQSVEANLIIYKKQPPPSRSMNPPPVNPPTRGCFKENGCRTGDVSLANESANGTDGAVASVNSTSSKAAETIDEWLLNNTNYYDATSGWSNVGLAIDIPNGTGLGVVAQVNSTMTAATKAISSGIAYCFLNKTNNDSASIRFFVLLVPNVEATNNPHAAQILKAVQSGISDMGLQILNRTGKNITILTVYAANSSDKVALKLTTHLQSVGDNDIKHIFDFAEVKLRAIQKEENTTEPSRDATSSNSSGLCPNGRESFTSMLVLIGAMIMWSVLFW